ATAGWQGSRNRSWVFYIQQRSEAGTLSLGKSVHRSGTAIATTPDKNHCQHADANQQQRPRTKPERQCLGIDRRLVTNEIAIAGHQELNDLLVAFPFFQHSVDFFAQIHGNGCVGISDVLVLALGAAQLLHQRTVTLAFGFILEFVCIGGGIRTGAEQHGHQHDPDQGLHSSTSCWYSGASFSRQTRSSMTPTYL